MIWEASNLPFLVLVHRGLSCLSLGDVVSFLPEHRPVRVIKYKEGYRRRGMSVRIDRSD